MFSEIRERKLVQWVVAYVAGAFIVLQGLTAVKEAWPEFAGVLRVAFVLALIGLPVVIVIGWFHGEQGRQRITVPELVLIAAVILVGGLLTVRLDVYGTDVESYAFAPDNIELDTTRYAVLPFRRDGRSAESVDQALLVHDALSDWDGIEVVDHLRVRDVIGEEERKDRSVAADLGAGRYVTGSATSVGPDFRISVGLFDTREGNRLAEVTAVISPGQSLETSEAARLVRELLFNRWSGLALVSDSPATSSYPARRAFLDGLEALDRWDLFRADSLFATAALIDPNYARAYFWRAQVQAWDERSPSELLGLLEVALTAPERLSGREHRLALALRHLGRDRFREACAVYDSLVYRDGRDFAAWFGLGECRARDDIVVRDSSSPSGWAFRSSYRRAVLAYHRAFELIPTTFRDISSRMFEQLGKRLRVSTGDLWPGRASPPDTLRFLARPALLADTLAFVPFPAGEVMSGRTSSRLPTFRAAVERQRRLYNDIAEQWAAAFPRSREALAALAHTRELVADPRALETLDAAISLTEDEHRRLLMEAERVNLLVKFGSGERMADARTLGDSVLEATDPTSPEELRKLAVTAAFVGRPNTAARWTARSTMLPEWRSDIPVPVRSPARALAVYAAMAGPADSIRAYEDLFEAALQNRIPPDARASTRSLLLVRAASLAFMVRPLQSFRQLAASSQYPVLKAQAAHAEGRRSEALRILADARDGRLHNDIQPSEISYDALFSESWLWAQLGDTASAIVMLDATLNTRRWSEPGSFDDPVNAAALVRAMALRADLAAATEDRSTARRWAEPVMALWGDADPALAPTTDRMQRILDALNRDPSQGGPGLRSPPPG